MERVAQRGKDATQREVCRRLTQGVVKRERDPPTKTRDPPAETRPHIPLTFNDVEYGEDDEPAAVDNEFHYTPILPNIVTKKSSTKRLIPSIVMKNIAIRRLGRRSVIKRIATKNKEDDINMYCIAITKQAGTVTEDLTQFDNAQMQQFVMRHRLVSSNYILNLKIIEPTKVNVETAKRFHRGSGLHKGDGEVVDHTYKRSNPYKVERHLTASEEAKVPDERYDSLACVVPLHIYLIYWPWSKLEGWNLKSNLKVCAISSWEFRSRGSVE